MMKYLLHELFLNLNLSLFSSLLRSHFTCFPCLEEADGQKVLFADNLKLLTSVKRLMESIILSDWCFKELGSSSVPPPIELRLKLTKEVGYQLNIYKHSRSYSSPLLFTCGGFYQQLIMRKQVISSV